MADPAVFRVVVPTKQLADLEQYFTGMPERFAALSKRWTSQAAQKVKSEWQTRIRSTDVHGHGLTVNWTGGYANSLRVVSNGRIASITVTGAARRYFQAVEDGSRPVGSSMLSKHKVYGMEEIRKYGRVPGKRFNLVRRFSEVDDLTGERHTVINQPYKTRQRSRYKYTPMTEREALISGQMFRRQMGSGEKDDYFFGFAKRTRTPQANFGKKTNPKLKGGMFFAVPRDKSEVHMARRFEAAARGYYKSAGKELGGDEIFGFGYQRIKPSQQRATTHRANKRFGSENYRLSRLEAIGKLPKGVKVDRRTFFQPVRGKGKPREQLYKRETIAARGDFEKKGTGRLYRVRDLKREIMAAHTVDPELVGAKARDYLGSGLSGAGTQRIMEWARSRFPQQYVRDYTNPTTGRRHFRGEIAKGQTNKNAYRLLAWIRTHGTKGTHVKQSVEDDLGPGGTLNQQITTMAYNLAEEFINGDHL